MSGERGVREGGEGEKKKMTEYKQKKKDEIIWQFWWKREGRRENSPLTMADAYRRTLRRSRMGQNQSPKRFTKVHRGIRAQKNTEKRTKGGEEDEKQIKPEEETGTQGGK